MYTMQHAAASTCKLAFTLRRNCPSPYAKIAAPDAPAALIAFGLRIAIERLPCWGETEDKENS